MTTTIAFNDLKKKLSEPPILAHYNKNYETELRTDASIIGIGYILMQKNPESLKWHPISFGSKKLNDQQRKYPISELECLAVIEGLKKNKCYLQGINFKIITDHIALKRLTDKKDLPGRLSRWSVVLTDFPGAEIVYRKGKEMNDVDLLSRHPIDEPMGSDDDKYNDEILFLITDSNQIPNYEDFLEAQSNNPRINRIVKEINEKQTISDRFFIKNELLYRFKNGDLVLELPEELIDNILYLHHDHQFSAHHGIERTLNRIRKRFHFNNMLEIVKKYVKSCADCQTRKRPVGKPYGLMEITKPKNVSEKWFIDFLGPFPVADKTGNKYISSMC